MYGCKADTLFAIRACMKLYPKIFNVFLLAISILLFGQAIRISEAPLVRITDTMNHYNFYNSVWLVILTMTTVGYGDIYPRTYIGRFIMFLCSMFGVVIVSFVVVTVRNELEMTTLESKAYTVIKKIEIKNKMKHEAATIIGKAAKLYLQVKKN